MGESKNGATSFLLEIANGGDLRYVDKQEIENSNVL